MEHIDDIIDLPDAPAGADPSGFAAPSPAAPGEDAVSAVRPEDAWWFQQSADGLCVPASCAMIFNQLTGQVIPESEFVAFAQQAGLLTWDGAEWSGMTAEDGAKMLELLGVEAQVADGATIDDLDRWVDIEGRNVILAVDSDEVWYGVDDDGAGDAGADHALRLAEVDTERGVAYLEDPGNPAGRGYVIALSTLEDALADSGGQVVVTGPPLADAFSTPGTVVDAVPTASGGWSDGLPLAPGAVAAAGIGAVILIRLVVEKANRHVHPRFA